MCRMKRPDEAKKVIKMDCPNCGKKLQNTTPTLTGHFKCMNKDCFVVRITVDWNYVKNMVLKNG